MSGFERSGLNSKYVSMLMTYFFFNDEGTGAFLKIEEEHKQMKTCLWGKKKSKVLAPFITLLLSRNPIPQFF